MELLLIDSNQSKAINLPHRRSDLQMALNMVVVFDVQCLAMHQADQYL
jgi:hypothetical protein